MTAKPKEGDYESGSGKPKVHYFIQVCTCPSFSGDVTIKFEVPKQTLFLSSQPSTSL